MILSAHANGTPWIRNRFAGGYDVWQAPSKSMVQLANIQSGGDRHSRPLACKPFSDFSAVGDGSRHAARFESVYGTRATP